MLSQKKGGVPGYMGRSLVYTPVSYLKSIHSRGLILLTIKDSKKKFRPDTIQI